jgi:hypothetical protein
MIKQLRMGVWVGTEANITNDPDADRLRVNQDKHIYASTYMLKSDPLSLGIPDTVDIQSGDHIVIIGVFKGFDGARYNMDVKDIDFLN